MLRRPVLNSSELSFPVFQKAQSSCVYQDEEYTINPGCTFCQQPYENKKNSELWFLHVKGNHIHFFGDVCWRRGTIKSTMEIPVATQHTEVSLNYYRDVGVYLINLSDGIFNLKQFS